MASVLRSHLDDLRRRVASPYFWPVMLLVGTSFGCVFLLLLFSTGSLDRMQEQRERQALERVVETAADMVRHDLQDYAKWDDAVRHISLGIEPGWVEDNVVAYLGKTQGYAHIFILDGSDRTIYSLSGGDARKRLGADFAASLPQVRAMPRQGNPIVSGFTRSGDTILIHSTAAIVPLTGKVGLPPGPTDMLVIARPVDRAFLRRTIGELGLQDARLSLAEPPPGVAAVPLAGAGAEAIGWIAWTPHRPGTQLLRQMAPALAGIALLALAAASIILRRGGRATEALQQSEIRARHHAYHDLLTRLPNRRALVEQISDRLGRGQRLAMLFMDLDGFKDANDVYGHGAGDLLLREAALRIATAAEDALVARAGGDEFAVLLVDPSPDRSSELSETILSRFRQPFALGSYHVTLGVSIGCAHMDGSGAEGHDELMRRADIAMYAAKADGKNCARAYSAELDEGYLMRMRLEADLRTSVRNGDLFVRYQPIVDAGTWQATSVEALARWSHPLHGEVPPDVFIPIAEMSDLINEIGEQVLRQACCAMRHVDLGLAVNLSPAQFWDRNLIANIRRVLKETDFPPQRLELEITESLLLRRPDRAAEVIDGLRSLGITIALDDFGTGFASIGYLQRLKLDRIKVDKAFVASLESDAKAREMLSSIVGLARAFDLEVSAEGVETAGQARIARIAGCTRLQGWHFGRPAAIAAIEPLAAAHAPPGRTTDPAYP